MKYFRKNIWIAALGCFAMSGQAGGAELRGAAGQAEATLQAGTCQGYFNGADTANGTMVIDDLIYSFSPSRLIVRSNGRLSSLNALRANQEIRYPCPMPTGTGRAVRQAVTEIWVDAK